MINLIFLGPPGCGKGTQASFLASNFGYTKLSTGDLLRKISREKTDLGIKISSILSKGEFISDDMVNQLIIDFYKTCDNKSKIILDGFPRNVVQAQELDKILSSYAEQVKIVFFFKLSDSTLIKRITGRYTCSSCEAIYNSFFCPTKNEGVCDTCGGTDFIKRSDDNEQVVKNRLDVYNNYTTPLLSYYENKLVEIDAEQSADDVYQQIVKHL